MESFIQKDVLCVERLEFWVFCCSSDFLGDEIISPKIETRPIIPMEEVQRPITGTNNIKKWPPLITKRNTEDLRPETVL